MTAPKTDARPAACRRLGISGRVQGVGYREWALRTARSLGLKGWVRNRSDGSVEAVVCGDAAALDQLVEACRAGPPMARVDAIDQRAEAIGDWPDFTIAATR